MVGVKRPEVAQRIHDAKEHGDLSENAEYEDAKNEQAFVEGRIQTLEALIKNATIIDENHSTDHVQIGSTVSVESPDGEETFTIVGSAEAKPAEGRISNESPVGRALLGKQEGREGRRPGARPATSRTRSSASPRATGTRVRGPTRSSATRSARGRVTVDEDSHGLGGRARGAVRDRGPQVVNDSKTPSGTVHVGSLRGPGHPRRHRPGAARERHRDDAPVRRRRPRPDGRPGAPDARRRRARDGPPARPRAGPGRRRPRVVRPPPRRDLHRHVRRARHPPRPLLLDERHLPDRARWTRSSGSRSTGPPLVREIYRRVANVQHPDDWHPVGVICPNCGKVGTTIVTDWDGERGLLRVPAGPRRRGRRGCGSSGWVSPFGGAAKLPWNLEWAAQWSLFGVTIEPCGKDLSTAGGSRDRSRRDRPRGLRARAAAQRAVRVPQHRRQEDVDVQGSRRGGPPDRRGHPARAAAVPVPPATPEPGDRVRPGRHRRDPAPVRRVRPVRRRDGRPRGQGRAAARPRGDVPLLAARPGRRRRGGGRGVPAGVLAPRAARPDPGRRRRRARRGGEGEPR